MTQRADMPWLNTETIKHGLTLMTSEQYAAIIWEPNTGLELSQLVRDAIASGEITEKDIPGGRITPPCPKRAEN